MGSRLPPGLLAGILVSGICTLWFVWTIEWGPLAAALSQLSLVWVAAAVSCLILEFVLRAMRWRALLRQSAPSATTGALFQATVMGAAANTLLPARAGEIVKPLVASKRTGASLGSLLATSVLERIYDLLGLVSVVLAMSLLLPESPAQSAEETVLVVNLKRYGMWLGVAGICGWLAFFSLTLLGERPRGWLERLARMLPGPPGRILLRLVEGAWEGLQGARTPRALLLSPILSLAIWSNGVLAIYFLFQAFSLSLPPGAACFTAAAIALAVVLPQAPGFLGVFHIAMEKTMLLWEVDPHHAKGFAVVFWGVSFIPVTLLGLLGLWREGLSLRGLWQQRD